MDAKPTSKADQRFLVLLAFQGLSLLLILGLAYLMFNEKSGRDSARAQLIRDTAAKLQAAGLIGEATNSYEEYLREPGIDARTRAAVAYSLGQMYETSGRPEKALAAYYEVEGSDPNSPERKEAAKRIVALLESLGRVQAAKSELSGATALEKGTTGSAGVGQGSGSSAGENSGKIVAQVGARKITLEELTAALDALPPALKSNFEGADGKKKFLRKFVADELLYDKAKRLQYDSDPKWLKNVEEMKRQSLIARVVSEEVLSKVSVDEKDLKNYFEANKGKYAQNKKTPAFDKVKQAVEQDYRMEKSQAKYQELIEQLVTGDDIKLFEENVK